jgi:hypothetical protein
VTVALILLEGLSFGVMLVGLVLLLAAWVDPTSPSVVGEKLLLWGMALVLVGAVGGVAVVATLV